VHAYERLAAWQVAYQLTLATYRATSGFPKHELYGLTSQTRRAAVSVVANIAEGSAKRGAPELRRYLNIALGSMAELNCLLRLAADLRYMSADDASGLDELRRRSGYLLWRLYSSIGRGGRD
jgi:four helix bundle protein